MLLDVPVEIVGPRLSGRRICAATGHPYHVDDRPPRRPDLCDLDGSALIQRPDDRPDVVTNRLQLQLAGLADVIDVYRARGLLKVVDGAASEVDVATAILDHWNVTASRDRIRVEG